jgi:hypothetical protein
MSAGAASAASNRFAPRRAVVRTGIIASCLLGAALASLGALKHFEAESRVAPEAHVELGTVTDVTDVTGATGAANSVVASLSPALPTTAPEGAHAPTPQTEHELSTPSVIARAGSTPASPGAARHNAAPSARATRTATTATVSASTVDKITDVSLPLDIGLGSKPRTDPTSRPEEPRKKLNGGKLIYGD